MFGKKVCIGGFPGIGSVGKVAADFMATSLKCSAIKPFFSSVFPAQAVISQGLAELLHAELRSPENRDDLLMLSGDAQPLEIIGMHSLAGEILDSLRTEGVSDVITLAAYVGETRSGVLGTATDVDSAAALERSGIPLLRQGAIGGLNGLLAGLAPIYGMRGFCLLGTTSGAELVDIKAAATLLEAIGPLFGLDLDVSLLRQEQKDVWETIPSDEPDMNYR
jgi:proteasome assembly chaperone (PAC2) family protein